MHLRRHSLALLALAIPTVLAAQIQQSSAAQLPLKHDPKPTVAAITPGDLMTRLYIFADDSMQGRQIGTVGHFKSTEYLARELQQIQEQDPENFRTFQAAPAPFSGHNSARGNAYLARRIADVICKGL